MWKHIAVLLNFLITFKFVICCDCALSPVDLNIEKRQLEEHDTTESSDNIAGTNAIINTSSYHSISTTSQSILYASNETTMSDGIIYTDNNFDSNENSSEIVEVMITGAETSFVTNDLEKTDYLESPTESWKDEKRMATHAQNDLREKCGQYKNGESFNLGKMIDVWQVVYYRLASMLKCFKLHIQPLTTMDQKRYARLYGSFNDTVVWDHVFLEITSSQKEHKGRRHFLQGTSAENGIMENIIMEEEHYKNSTSLTLHRESGDQWLVIGTLLLMRDCENGDYVVFTKVPTHPEEADIMNALKSFGLDNPNGTKACNVENTWLIFEE